jgi:hypothetical protein
MIDNFLRIAGVKNEAEFYSKYPSKESFFKDHPEAMELSKFEVGGDNQSDYNMAGYAMHHPFGALKHFINPDKYHATDEYKYPNHMTFSDESKYSNTEHQGGHWSQTPDGKWTFTPTEWNIQNAGGPEQYQQWWDQGEGKNGNVLILPQHADGGALFKFISAQRNPMMLKAAEGLQIPGYTPQEGDNVYTNTTQHTLGDLKNNNWNKGLAIANSLGNYNNAMDKLPNQGLFGKIKAASGIASGLSGSILGYEKMFNPNKTTTNTIANADTNEFGKAEDIVAQRAKKAQEDKVNEAIGIHPPMIAQTDEEKKKFQFPNFAPGTPEWNSSFGASSTSTTIPTTISTPIQQTSTPNPTQTASATTPTTTGFSGMESINNQNQIDQQLGLTTQRYGGLMKFVGGGTFKEWFAANAQRPDVMSIINDHAALQRMYLSENPLAETNQGATGPTNNGMFSNPAASSAISTPAQSTGKGMTPSGGSGMAAVYNENNKTDWTNPQVAGVTGSGPTAPNNGLQFKQFANTSTKRGDDAGTIAANNALAGLGMANAALGTMDKQAEYNKRLREIGNTNYNTQPSNPTNPFGNYTLNAGPASNFGLVANTPAQDIGTGGIAARYGGTKTYKEGGTYLLSPEEVREIMANGGEIEFL